MDSAYATIMHFVHLRSCKVQLHLFWMESPYISVQVPLPRVAGEIFKCNNNYYLKWKYILHNQTKFIVKFNYQVETKQKEISRE